MSADVNFTKTNLIKNTANVRKLIVIKAPSADGKSICDSPPPISPLLSRRFVGQSSFIRFSEEKKNVC